jgi:hypothetical protein
MKKERKGNETSVIATLPALGRTHTRALPARWEGEKKGRRWNPGTKRIMKKMDKEASEISSWRAKSVQPVLFSI